MDADEKQQDKKAGHEEHEEHEGHEGEILFVNQDFQWKFAIQSCFQSLILYALRALFVFFV